MTLFEALMGGAFDCLNRQHNGKFYQNLSKKLNALGFAWGQMDGFGIDWYITQEFSIENSCIIIIYLHIYGLIIDPHNNLLPVGLIMQLVEHCTGIAGVRVQIPVQAFLAAA